MIKLYIHKHNSQPLTNDANHYISILVSHGFKELGNCLLQSKNLCNMPALTYLILYFNDIFHHLQRHPSITSEELSFFSSFDYIHNFSERVLLELPSPINIPNNNLLHSGLICHLNVCISMLS